jgi:uncharacterized membrane protein YbhN (UPF0104 family)
VLTLAGATPDQAVLATLLYRLFQYWLPLPTGLVAAQLYRRRHRNDPNGNHAGPSGASGRATSGGPELAE